LLSTRHALKNKIFALKEPLIVWGIMTIIFLPARFLFVHYIGNNWIGSFGLPTCMALVIIYLTKKEKLGWFGKMLVNQITKRLKKGKLKILFYLQTFFLITISVFLIYSIHYGDSIKTNTLVLERNMINKIVDLSYNPSFRYMPSYEVQIEGPVFFLTLAINNFPLIAKLISNLNIQYHDWLLTLYTVSLFEHIEAFGVIQLYRKMLIRKD